MTFPYPHGAPPPRNSNSSAGDTEVVSMVRDREVLRNRVWRAGIACVSAAFLLGAPSLAGARTRVTDTGPSPSGDPTADDQPDPTPKQKSAGLYRSQTQQGPVSLTSRPSYRFVWLTYVRALIRITIR